MVFGVVLLCVDCDSVWVIFVSVLFESVVLWIVCVSDGFVELDC